MPPDALLTTAAILSDIWSRLKAGRDHADHPFRTAAFATTADGAVTARTIVIRRVEPEVATLTFHTDRRSEKFAALGREPRCALLFWDAADKVQVRLQATATLHTDDAISEELWAATPPPARAMYASLYAPGSPLNALQRVAPETAGDGRDHFAAVRCTVETIDWLYLHKIAHRRARFDLRHGGVASMFIAP